MVTVDRQQLIDGLRATRGVAKCGPKTIWRGHARLDVSDGHVDVRAVSADSRVTTRIPARGAGKWTATVPVGPLLRVLGGVDADEVRLRVNEYMKVELGFGESAYTFFAPPVDGWPADYALPRDGGTTVTFSAEFIARLRKVGHAASRDESRPILTVFAFGPSDVAATDSYRLAIEPYGHGRASFDLPAERVPVDARGLLAALPKSGDVTVIFGQVKRKGRDKADGWVAEVRDGATVTQLHSTLARFPNVEALLTVRDGEATYSKAELVAAVSRLAAAGVSHVEVADGAIRQMEEFGSTTVSDARETVKHVGDKIRCGLNSRYFLDALRQCEGADVTLHFKKEKPGEVTLKPIYFTSAVAGRTYLTMPTRFR